MKRAAIASPALRTNGGEAHHNAHHVLNCASTSLEVVLIDQDFTLAARGRGDHAFGLHHIDKACGAAEADPQPALQVRNGGLAGRDDNARGLVVEVVALELEFLGVAFSSARMLVS
jgi:hypothetical protein